MKCLSLSPGRCRQNFALPESCRRGRQDQGHSVRLLLKRELNLADLYRAGSLQAHCLDIQLNRDVYWPMLAHLRRERESEELQRDLIQADAPLEMMRSLFGVGSREYTRLRRMLAVEPAVGRPPEPNEETAHRLWHALSARLEADEGDGLSPNAYLAVHRDTGASLRTIWNLAQRFFEYGDVYAPSEGPRRPLTRRRP